VLATVIEASGSAPQTAGAAAVFTAAGLLAGTVGGGAVEAKVEKSARSALRTGRSRLLMFDLAEDYSEDADAICGGRMRILLEARPERSRAAFEAWRRAESKRGSGVLAVRIRSLGAGRGVEVSREWIPAAEATGGASAEALAARKPRLETRGKSLLFLEPRSPRPRLVIAGAGHVGRAVARMGDFLGFETIVIDDRAELLVRGRFPDSARLVRGEIAGRTARFRRDRDAFIVIVTRGHRHDAETLRACLGGRARYIGMIGSGRKVALLKESFLAQGWATEAEWARVRTPIGLPIGSRTVEEIAVSIAAELVAARSGRL
jgi:xanthine dehydrogenase accessory factor